MSNPNVMLLQRYSASSPRGNDKSVNHQDELFVETNRAPRGDVTATDEEHVYWPFQGEYWKDELGSYYYYIRSECGR